MAVSAPSEKAFQTIKAEVVLRSLRTVAFDAIGLENGLNVFVESDSILSRSRGQLGEVNGEDGGRASKNRDGGEMGGSRQVFMSHMLSASDIPARITDHHPFHPAPYG